MNDVYVRADGARHEVRKDGRCLECGGDRTPKKGVSGQTGVLAWRIKDALEDDPFCSATCCRQWHGVAVPETTQQKAARKRAEAMAA